MHIDSFINKSKNYTSRIGSFRNELHRPSLLRKIKAFRVSGRETYEGKTDRTKAS